MDFVEKLKTLRKEANLTQQEVADKLYVSRSLYAKYESGIATPDKDMLQKIALLFNTSVNDLVSCEETTSLTMPSRPENHATIVQRSASSAESAISNPALIKSSRAASVSY